jgi:AcrR family transcriptional regulator
MSDLKRPGARLRVQPQPALKLGKSERTRAVILNASLDFLWSHPFRDMTVGSLMAATGVSRSAFYQYFEDRHDLMETLLDMLQDEIFEVAAPWISGTGDPVALLRETLSGLARVGYRTGPLLRAVTDAAATDERLEAAWKRFLGRFDDAACDRIEADQNQGLIPAFDARPVAIALTRLDAFALLEAFGQRPRSRPEPVEEALARIWISTLYGAEWLERDSSSLVRN